MEIVESAAEGSKKQMNEVLTVAASSAEDISNSNVTGSSAANSSAAAASTTDKKKENTSKTATTGSTDVKDMDIEIEEIQPKSSAPASFSKVDEKTQQPSAKLTSSVTVASSKRIDHDIPIISISDGEDAVGQHTPTTAQKVSRKRNSVGAAKAEDEQFLLKRRKIKVAGAPKMPLTGYVRYMNDRRESLRKELPTKTAIEHTKIIGEEWQKMINQCTGLTFSYLDELHTFLKERPDVLACELAKSKQQKNKGPGEAGKPVLKEKSQSSGNIKSPNKEPHVSTNAASKDKSRRNSEKDNSPPPAAKATDNKHRRKRTPTPPRAQSSNNNRNTIAYTSTPNNATSGNNHNSKPTTETIDNTASTLLSATVVPGEIPIFTNEFLEHNKIFDMELRTLRKSKSDLDTQNAVLEKHVENMKFGVEKLTNENDELAEKNHLLELYLEKLKSKLAQALSSLALPTQPNGATMDNIEKYMGDLYKMATTNTHGPASLNKAKDIIRKLDLQINL
ncbi:high mobility group protein 20A [Rhagoletis pomonella]|uniref:high mobility group protein 20A n=1 Tax=Rhagoletis pomonella TaxID=28610 RepID=UPI00178185B0|nr:high mobility group protein 20A [Rhagoletis pomonella]